MAFLAQIDTVLFTFLAGTAQTWTILVWFGVFCAKFLIYFIPFHLLILWFIGGLVERKAAVAVVLAVFLGLIISHAIGVLFFRPRPFAAGLGAALIDHKNNASFPSNHALIFAAYGVTLYLCRYKNAAMVALALGVLTCWARVFTGVHYPFDIVGGVVIGAIMSAVTLRFILPLVPTLCYHIPPLREQKMRDIQTD
ncbi:undecaprenyl-diphosphatase [Bartonella sp. LJL80]